MFSRSFTFWEIWSGEVPAFRRPPPGTSIPLLSEVPTITFPANVDVAVVEVAAYFAATTPESPPTESEAYGEVVPIPRLPPSMSSLSVAVFVIVISSLFHESFWAEPRSKVPAT